MTAIATVLEDRSDLELLYRDMFHASAVSAWHIDTKALGPLFERLTAEGASDLFAYARQNPGFVREAQEAMLVIDVNDETLRLFGASDRNEIVGGSAAPFWIDGRNDAFLECINVTYAGTASFRGETWLRTLDGREIYVLFTKSETPRLRAAGEAILSIVDLTERVKAQHSLEEAKANLAHSARVSLLGELTASIAHEVNQPMTAIMTYGEAGLRWLSQPDPALHEVRDAMVNMMQAADRAAKVIDRIRSMVAPTSDKRSDVCINDVIEDAMRFVAPELRKLEVVHTLQLEPDLPHLHGDPIQLQQVVINLALNAAQAMASSSHRNLAIRTMHSGAGQVAALLEDTGSGIDVAHEGRIFESFFTTKPSGMGIGLAVCRSIIEAYGGVISVENRPNGGAVASVSLPAKIAPRSPTAHPEHSHGG